MADKTYEILGKTVRIVPDNDVAARKVCEGCAFAGDRCPTRGDLPDNMQTCVFGEHHYIEVK